MPAEASFARIVDRLSSQEDVRTGSSFHSPSLKVRGKIFAMLTRGELVVKLPAVRCKELEKAGLARAFVIGPRTMREWAVVGVDRSDDWLALAQEALDHVRPMKPSAVARRRALATAGPRPRSH